MDEIFRSADDLGPFKVIHVYNSSIDLRAVLVVDNIAMGPAIGGVRMAEDVTTKECIRLARAMTLKNAAAGLPHGGGKVVVQGDPKMPRDRKQTIVRGLAQALKTETSYIFAPDMGMDEECMAWIRDEIERVVALPRELGGIPLDEIGATGWGLSHAADVASEFCGFSINGARIVVQGFGAVGRQVSRFLTAKGAILVAVADSKGVIHHPEGLDFDKLTSLKEKGESVTCYPGGQQLNHDELIGIDCEIWIPAARPDVIHGGNVDRINTRLVIEGANIAVTAEAEQVLYDKNIICIPDFIANAGGVICAAMEYQGTTEQAAMAAIEEKLRHNTESVLAIARRDNIRPREAGHTLALERIQKAMSFRRWSTFSTGPSYL